MKFASFLFSIDGRPEIDASLYISLYISSAHCITLLGEQCWVFDECVCWTWQDAKQQTAHQLLQKMHSSSPNPRGGACLRTPWVLKNEQSEYPWVPWVLTEYPLRTQPSTHWEPALFFLFFFLRFFSPVFFSNFKNYSCQLFEKFTFWELAENPLRTQPIISPENSGALINTPPLWGQFWLI